MSKKKRIANRKCSALLAAGTGAAVCLTGGGVHATNGMVAVSNGTSTFTGTNTAVTVPVNLMGSKAGFKLTYSTLFSAWVFSTDAVGTPQFHINAFALASVNITVGQSFPFPGISIASVPPGVYFPIRFNDSGLKVGWVHAVGATATTINMDMWSYNNSGGSIKTLSDSVTTSRLALTDGKEKLHWSNDNEDGVARYEVQSQDASGAWQAADSDVPGSGSGSYSAKVAAGKTCRLVVEMTDGSTKEIDF